jgi:hypothetical protein
MPAHGDFWRDALRVSQVATEYMNALAAKLNDPSTADEERHRAGIVLAEHGRDTLWINPKTGRPSFEMPRLLGDSDFNPRLPPALFQMRPHPARREPRALAPTAQHLPSWQASALGFSVPPSSVEVLYLGNSAGRSWHIEKWARILAPGELGAATPAAGICGARLAKRCREALPEQGSRDRCREAVLAPISVCLAMGVRHQFYTLFLPSSPLKPHQQWRRK